VDIGLIQIIDDDDLSLHGFIQSQLRQRGSVV